MSVRWLEFSMYEEEMVPNIGDNNFTKYLADLYFAVDTVIFGRIGFLDDSI